MASALPEHHKALSRLYSTGGSFMSNKRRRHSTTSSQQLFEQDWQAFTTQFPEFLGEIDYFSPQSALHVFGCRTDEPEMGLNGVALFGFCVWQQAYGKGDAEVRDGIVGRLLAEFPELIELRNLIIRRCAHAQEEAPRSGRLDN